MGEEEKEKQKNGRTKDRGKKEQIPRKERGRGRKENRWINVCLHSNLEILPY
jgi:hypothetical protein